MPKKKQEEPEISKKMKDFCKYFIETKWKKGESAVLAGYSKRTANAQATRLLKKVKVQEYLNQLIEDDLGFQRGQLRHFVLSEMKAIASADITKDIELVTKTRKIPRKTDQGEIIKGEFDEKEYQEVVMKDTKDSKQTRAIKSISQNRYGEIKVEYYDKDSALKQLGQFAGLWKDNPVVVDNSTDNSVTNNIDYSNLSPEEAKQKFLDKINQGNEK